MQLRPALPLLLALAACGAPKPVVEPPPKPEKPLPAVAYPRALQDLNPDPRVVEVHLEAKVAQVELEPGKPTEMWTYDGGVPGPLLQARVGDRVIVHFTNHLPEATTIHWHGLRISDQMDGVPSIQGPVEPGATFDYDFVAVDAGSFWYHPHMRTEVQVERGLAGPIVIHEAEEQEPDFDVQRYFVVDDIRLEDDGSISPNTPTGMDRMHGRLGNRLLLNGELKPTAFSYERGQVERWRLVNTANARTFVLGIEGATYRIVGTDGGLLPESLPGPRRLELPIGARYDLEVRYTADAARLVTYVPYLDANNEVQTQKLTLVEGASSGTAEGDPERAIQYPPPMTLPAIPEDAPSRSLVLSGKNTARGVVFTINGKAWPEMEEWTVAQHAPTLITIKNELGMEHPFHLHGNFFQVVSRNGRPANLPGLRDTVLIGGQDEVVIASAFENPGEWMYHCHIPEHSENGMMGMLHVTAAEDGHGH